MLAYAFNRRRDLVWFRCYRWLQAQVKEIKATGSVSTVVKLMQWFHLFHCGNIKVLWG